MVLEGGAGKRILQQNSLAQHWAQDWARDWRALALTQVHHWSRLSDSGEDGEALSSVHSTALAAGKLIHNLLCDGRVLCEKEFTGKAARGARCASGFVRRPLYLLCAVHAGRPQTRAFFVF